MLADGSFGEGHSYLRDSFREVLPPPDVHACPRPQSGQYSPIRMCIRRLAFARTKILRTSGDWISFSSRRKSSTKSDSAAACRRRRRAFS
jgi:hypothetical protein